MPQPRICPSCHCSFHQDFVCTTCGAEKLYDATLKSLQAENAELRKALKEIVDCPTWAVGTLIADRYKKLVEAQS